MKNGRAFVPTAVLDARGAFIHNPQLRRPNEPKTTRPLGPPPKWCSPEQKAVWKDLAKQALPGVLMYSDRTAFEMLVVLTEQFRQRAPLSHGDKTLMFNLLAHFAMTPSDRAKVQVEQPKESALTKFMKKPTANRPAILSAIPFVPPASDPPVN